MSVGSQSNEIESPEGGLAVLLPGLGAVGTTAIAGVMAIRRGWAEPIGSLTQMGRLAAPSEPEPGPRICDALPLASLDDLVFGGWDLHGDNGYEAARRADVLSDDDLEALRSELESIEPMPAVFDSSYVRNIEGSHVKEAETKMEAAEMLTADIHRFLEQHDADRAVSIWCGSTERHRSLQRVHHDLDALEAGLRHNHEAISPTMIYAYAHIRAGVPFLNGAPNRSTDCPALVELAERRGIPLAGRDLKTGQTLLKTVLAPGLAARKLGVDGWYSTNILGNRDGAVLDDPGSFESKEESKRSVLSSILDPEHHESLYGDADHQVHIHYYRPRGDNKEAWDNIDLTGWMGYPMQLKIDFLCRDSILAAPLVLDLALLGDLARRAGESGLQEWLSFYFKSPDVGDGARPVHDLFAQQEMLLDRLRSFREAL
jgi:myo-inositol-1-phosphate synthase